MLRRRFLDLRRVSPGRDRIRRHNWISPFWTPLGKRPLLVKCGPPSFINNSTSYIYISIYIITKFQIEHWDSNYNVKEFGP